MGLKEEGKEVTASPSHTHLLTPPGFPPHPSSAPPLSPTRPITTLLENGVCVLEPSSKNSSPEPIPSHLLLSDLVQVGSVYFSQLVFLSAGGTDGGGCWRRWVEEMAREEKFVNIWRKAGIEDAIMGSINLIRIDEGAMEALIGFWCPSTRTFVMPWGEITFTLEDAHVLGNLPIRGAMLKRDLTVAESRLRQRLLTERELIWKRWTKHKHLHKLPYHHVWFDYFVKLDADDELRHLGFLVYWLSRYVIPSEFTYEVPTEVFGIAARLSIGERIALAPAVTANIYQTLTQIARRIGIVHFSSFHLLQAWIWEHFDSLQPCNQIPITKPSKVLIARWNSKFRDTEYEEAVKILRDERSFAWRPYVRELDNWIKPEWYRSKFERILITKDAPDWVHDFLAILSTAELVRFSGGKVPIETYNPHRVARQFGYDQAIPGSSSKKAALPGLNTDFPMRAEVFIPEMLKQSCPLTDYVKWWGEYITRYCEKLKKLKEYMKLKNNIEPQVLASIQYKKVAEEGEKEGREEERVKTRSSNMVSDDRDRKIRKIVRDGKEHEFSNGKSEVNDDNDGGGGGDEEEKEETMSSNMVANAKLKNIVDEMQGPMVKRQTGTNISVEVRRIEKETINQGDSSSMQPKSIEHSLEVPEDIQRTEKDEELVAELEEFKHQNFMCEWLPNLPPMNSSKKKCRNDNEDPYGEEVMKKYPQFFKLIPQHPHYRGLLQQNTHEAIKRSVYRSLWYTLIDLMRKALTTTCHTSTTDIQQWSEEAQELEMLGFDVRHLIARLKVPKHRLQKLEAAKINFQQVKRRVEENEKLMSLETQINELRDQLWNIEKKHDELRDQLRNIEKKRDESMKFLTSTDKHIIDSESRTVSLRKEFEDAQSNLLAREHDAEILGE